jgi:hypothetical protein
MLSTSPLKRKAASTRTVLPIVRDPIEVVEGAEATTSNTTNPMAGRVKGAPKVTISSAVSTSSTTATIGSRMTTP